MLAMQVPVAEAAHTEDVRVDQLHSAGHPSKDQRAAMDDERCLSSLQAVSEGEEETRRARAELKLLDNVINHPGRTGNSGLDDARKVMNRISRTCTFATLPSSEDQSAVSDVDDDYTERASSYREGRHKAVSPPGHEEVGMSRSGRISKGSRAGQTEINHAGDIVINQEDEDDHDVNYMGVVGQTSTTHSQKRVFASRRSSSKDNQSVTSAAQRLARLQRSASDLGRLASLQRNTSEEPKARKTSRLPFLRLHTRAAVGGKSSASDEEDTGSVFGNRSPGDHDTTTKGPLDKSFAEGSSDKNLLQRTLTSKKLKVKHGTVDEFVLFPQSTKSPVFADVEPSHGQEGSCTLAGDADPSSEKAVAHQHSGTINKCHTNYKDHSEEESLYLSTASGGRGDPGREDPGSVQSHVFESVLGLWTCSVPQRTATYGGGLLKLSYAVLIMITINSYTANLATMLLISQARHRGIQRVEECYDNQKNQKCQTVCIASQIQQELFASHPQLRTRVFPSSSSTLQGFVDGLCDATVVPDHDVKARADFQQTLVDRGFMMVGKPLFSMTVGTPVTKRIAAAYSLLSLQLHYEGAFAHYYNLYTPRPGSIMRNEMNDPGLPLEGEAAEMSEAEGLQLTTRHFVGLFFTFGMCAAVALLSLVHMQWAYGQIRRRCNEILEAGAEQRSESVGKAFSQLQGSCNKVAEGAGRGSIKTYAVESAFAHDVRIKTLDNDEDAEDYVNSLHVASTRTGTPVISEETDIILHMGSRGDRSAFDDRTLSSEDDYSHDDERRNHSCTNSVVHFRSELPSVKE
ncbi:unnamed protein product [Amoebophrya sp. A25]|nr:unnamed protein product [Amoebophrya sp. A25]|eukprot:GSA25T00004834001.1